ncbi:MAG: gephyrin-like molybdotransferase Glp [Acidobacteriota bacterium]
MLLSPEAAWRRLEDEISVMGAESVSRQEACARILAADVAATVDAPPADVSAMDGYVLRGDVPVDRQLSADRESAAGHPPEFALGDGEVARIMTGAVIPEGGDRVVPVELTDTGPEGRRQVTFRRDVDTGANIRRAGEVVRAGSPLLRAGSLLTPAAISLLATHGHREVSVVRRPRIAILSSGDEVIPPDETPKPGQLRDSNTVFLQAAAASLGLEAESLGIAADRRDDLVGRIQHGLSFDVLLLCGGVSKGEYDLVEDVLAELGCRSLFDAVAIQPGKPLVAARHGGEGAGWVFGLPGNPASVMVTFWLFVRPVLRRLQGYADGFWHGALRGRLDAPLRGARDRDRFLPAEIQFDDGVLGVSPAPPKGSHDNAAYARGTALVRVPREQAPRDVGGECEVLPLFDWPASVKDLSSPKNRP